jgi:hypothetical protein
MLHNGDTFTKPEFSSILNGSNGGRYARSQNDN